MTRDLHLFVTGSTGQVGHALLEAASAAGVRVTAPERRALDLADPGAVRAAVLRARPDAVVNAAAYTAVDRAEEEPAAAFAANRAGARHLAAACADARCALLHLSTDYVFDGTRPTPYPEDAPASPLGVYGRSKWEGEEAVRAALDRHLILRVSWVFSARRHNFVKTMLRLGAEHETLRVVADQHGRPTAAADIAGAVLTMLDAALRDGFEAWGTYHYGGAPVTSWHGFAEAVFAAARARGLPLAVREVVPIATADYPTPAPRPPRAVLALDRVADTFGLAPPDWRPALDAVVRELAG